MHWLKWKHLSTLSASAETTWIVLSLETMWITSKFSFQSMFSPVVLLPTSVSGTPHQYNRWSRTRFLHRSISSLKEGYVLQPAGIWQRGGQRSDPNHVILCLKDDLLRRFEKGPMKLSFIVCFDDFSGLRYRHTNWNLEDVHTHESLVNLKTRLYSHC